MRVAQIQIRNVLGIEELDIAPGNLTVVRGKNGQGKTSTLEAIRAALSGGHDATLLRSGAESGEVVLVLDDGVEVRKKITEARSTVTVTHPEYGKIGGPQTYLDKLTDALSVNPVAFLTAPAKKRGEYLLEAAPLTLDRAEVKAAVGDLLDAVPTDGPALDVLAALHKRLYDERTGVNRTTKEKRTTAVQLSESLPDEAEANGADAESLRAERSRIDHELGEVEIALDRKASAAIDALREETQAKIDALKEAATKKADEIRQAAIDEADTARQKVVPELDRLTAEIATAEERERQAERIRTTREVVAKLTKEANDSDDRAKALTAAMDSLAALKGKLLADLPFDGVEVIGGEVFKDGIPFDRLNRAAQVRLAVELAGIRAGDLGLVCVDGLECLDEETFAAFCAEAGEAALQFVVTRVGEGALAVETLAGAAA